MDSLKDRVVLVTGGTSGIGFAAAAAFARAGARVVISGRGRERGIAAERAIREQGGEVAFVAGDVSQRADVEALVARTVELYGGLDVAVNNAASSDVRLAPTAELTEEEFDHTIAVDLKGVWLGMKYEIARMLGQPSGGVIINVSSVNGLSGTPMASLYSAAKFGVLGLTRSAALEYAKSGIRINAVCPGAVRTPMLESMMERMAPGDLPAAVAAYEGHIPMGRIAAPDELAQSILWLASGGASYVTGAVITVDGGIAAGLA